MPDFADVQNRGRIEKREEWRSWCGDEMPWLDFPDEWEVQVIPPFGGALVRFKVRRDDMPEDKAVSIYFDAHSRLGAMPYPYWDVYPVPADYMVSGKDARRHKHDEVDDLLDTIKESLDYLSTQ